MTLGSHHLHIKSTLMVCIRLTQMEADLLSVLFFEGSNYLPLLFRASSFPDYKDDNNTPQADPLLPEDLFPHTAFPF